MIFDTSLDGHHIEYLHHIYMSACENNCNAQFIFAVPKEFEKQKNKLSWIPCNWIKIIFIEDKDVELCKEGNYFTKSWNYSKVLKKYTQLYKVDELFLITLIYPYPFLPLFLKSNIKVSGIVYRIYLYEWKTSSFLKKIKDAFETFVMAKAKCTKSIFILNDNSAACYFNKLFKVNKFKFLTDPINPTSSTPKNIRQELQIAESKEIYLHFGAMYERKGTLTILDAIELLSKEELENKCFIFAGKIGNDIKEAFYKKKKILDEKVKILVYDEFCSYDFLNNLCFSCDYIVIPYKNISCSSGVVGYAAQLRKTLIAPKDGILGKLVKRFNLGITTNISDPSELALVIRSKKLHASCSDRYIQANSVTSFCNRILSNLS